MTIAMDSIEIRETILSWETVISETMRRRVHYYSMKNFVLHYHEIPSTIVRENICKLLSGYIDEVKANDYDFEPRASYFLARKYLDRLSDYYKEYAHFMKIFTLKSTLMFGFLADSLLYLSGLLSKIWHIPIVTIGLMLYYIFIVIFKEPKGRVFSIFY